jgi:hypothetical protein
MAIAWPCFCSGEASLVAHKDRVRVGHERAEGSINMAAGQSRKRQIAEDDLREKAIAQMGESLRVLSGVAESYSLKNLLMVGAALTGAALLVKRLASRSGGFDFERLIERMPENAPPKWIFRNISAIRENTERILQVLESERTSAGPEPRQDPAA